MTALLEATSIYIQIIEGVSRKVDAEKLLGFGDSSCVTVKRIGTCSVLSILQETICDYFVPSVVLEQCNS